MKYTLQNFKKMMAIPAKQLTLEQKNWIERFNRMLDSNPGVACELG